MKKLALVLGTLLLAATASAKEVVAAPVVVEEVTVEEAVIVPTPEFKATGYFKMENEWRGDKEGSKGDKNYIRTELKTGVKFTENDRIDVRTRHYDDIDTGSVNGKDTNGDLRARYEHAFGYMGDSKVQMTSRIQARQYEGDNGDNYQAGMIFDFVDYMPKTENFAFDYVQVMPKVMYLKDDGSAQDAVGSGIEFYSYAGTDTENFGRFEYEFNVYSTYVDGKHQGIDPDDGGLAYNGSSSKFYDSGMYTEIEAYIYHAYPLWTSTDSKYKVELYHEGGVDPIHFGSKSPSDDDTTVYYEPRFRLHQKINAATTFTYAVGAYYSNTESNDWDHTAEYAWEPRVSFTLKTTF